MPLTYGALCALAEKHNVTITESVRAFVRDVEQEDLRARAQSSEEDTALADALRFYLEQSDGITAWVPSEVIKAILARTTANSAPPAAVDQHKSGLYRKFLVLRWDGRDAPGGDKHGAEYFVLDLTHDKHSRNALISYAASCKREYPALARDLMAKASAMPADEWQDREYHGDPEREWNEFWADICAPDGKPDLAQIKLELSDLSMLMHHVPRVYSHVTGGLISIPTTLPDVVCSVHDGHVQDLCEDAVKDAQEEAAQQQAEPPLGGRWHFGNGAVVCGTLRIFGEDFDTDPAEDFKENLLQWVCNTLNAAQSAHRAGQRAGVTEVRAYPDELSDALRHVLGFPNFKCSPFAHLMRDAGAEIERKAEIEQATVLHWLIKLVLDHGEKWAEVAESEMKAMRVKIAAAATQQQEVAR